MRISYYKDIKNPISNELEVSWDELKALLSEKKEHICAPVTPPCARKLTGDAWSPGVVPGGARRASANVSEISALVFDVDHAHDSQIEAIAEKIDKLGLACILHSSHSHAPPSDNCIRLVFPVSRPLAPRELPSIRSKVEALLGFKADAATKDPSRVYFLPNIPEGAPFLFAATEGQPVDVDALAAAPAPAPPPTLQVVTPEAPGPVDMNAAWRRLLQVRKQESLALVKAMRKGEPLAQRGARDISVVKAASIIAGALPELPTEAALAIMRPSIAAMPYELGESENFDHFMRKAAYAFEKARERRRSQLSADSQVNARLLQKLGQKIANESPATEAGIPSEMDPDDWRRGLVLKPFDPDSPDKVQLANVPANAGLIMEYADDWIGRIRWNSLTKRPEFNDCPPGPMNVATAHTEIANWFTRSEWGLRPYSGDIKEQIILIARKNEYDPVKDYLNSLTWDGRPRLDSMLAEIFHAKTKSADGRDISAFIEGVSSAWMISAVARALRPGCQVDTVLILESEKQGYGKSSALRILGGPFYASMRINLRDKDAMMLAGTAWILEIAELDSFNRAEAALAKAFFTETKDTFRLPYSPAMEEFPRRCVFAGTTNETGYLNDRENRRYWPIEITSKIDLKRLAAERDQLWAEAVHRYLQGEAYHFTDELAELAHYETEARTTEDPYVACILEWWQRIPPDRRPREITTHQVMAGAFEFKANQLTRGLMLRLGGVLKSLGCERGPYRGGSRVYRVSDSLASLPHTTTAGAREAPKKGTEVPKSGD